MPLCETLGVRAEQFTPDEVRLALEWSHGLCTTNGLIHGGVLMALADAAGGACAYLNLPEDASGTATIESKTNFFGAVRDGTVTAASRPLHIGSSSIVIETDLWATGGRHVAKVLQTQLVLRPQTAGRSRSDNDEGQS